MSSDDNCSQTFGSPRGQAQGVTPLAECHSWFHLVGMDPKKQKKSFRVSLSGGSVVLWLRSWFLAPERLVFTAVLLCDFKVSYLTSMNLNSLTYKNEDNNVTCD